jgi:hypothetical protein
METRMGKREVRDGAKYVRAVQCVELGCHY